MIKLFDKTQAKCKVCDTPVDGRRERNGYYYCATHYDSTSQQEKHANYVQNQRKRNYDKAFR